MSNDGNASGQTPIHHPVDRGHHYLEWSVRTASPSRLRLMLLERAVEVCGSLASRWRSGHDLGVNEGSLKLLDLLTELLNGVKGGSLETENQVCHQVADLYVFLCQHLVSAESTSHADAIDEIRLVLETEAETWRLVCAQEVSPTTSSSRLGSNASSGLDLRG